MSAVFDEDSINDPDNIFLDGPDSPEPGPCPVCGEDMEYIRYRWYCPDCNPIQAEDES